MSEIDRRCVIAGLAAASFTRSALVRAASENSVEVLQDLKRINTNSLDLAYLEAGPADGPPVILLHGFPYDAHAYDRAAARLAAAGRR